MLFSISVSFTNRNVNHIVIFELKNLKKNKKKNYKMDELGVKFNGPVSSWNLDFYYTRVPGFSGIGRTREGTRLQDHLCALC
jgi:hypothetical protein